MVKHQIAIHQRHSYYSQFSAWFVLYLCDGNSSWAHQNPFNPLHFNFYMFKSIFVFLTRFVFFSLFLRCLWLHRFKLNIKLRKTVHWENKNNKRKQFKCKQQQPRRIRTISLRMHRASTGINITRIALNLAVIHSKEPFHLITSAWLGSLYSWLYHSKAGQVGEIFSGRIVGNSDVHLLT